MIVSFSLFYLLSIIEMLIEMLIERLIEKFAIVPM